MPENQIYRAIKATGAAGVAAIKAHPYVFCGIVVVSAVAFIVYKIQKSNSEKERALTYSSHSSDADPSVPVHGNTFFYDPETKSVVDSAAPVSNVSDNNLRKRKNAQGASSTVKKNDSETPSDKKNNLAVSKGVQTESNDNNRDSDNVKVLPEKNIATAMSVEEKINKFFRRASPDAACTESSSSNNKSEEEKFTNGEHAQCCDNSTVDSEEYSDTSSLSSTSSSSWSNISLKKKTAKRVYVEDVCRSLNEDLNNMNQREASRSPSVCSIRSIETESSIGTVLSGDSEVCRACEVNPVNTCIQPCNHRYMCSDCAMRVCRLFKRCKVCRGKIERIVVAE